MRSGTIAFLIGVVCLQTFAALPSLYWATALPLAVFGLWQPRLRWLAAMTLGALWALLYGHWLIAHDWPKACEGQDVLASGTILSIPVQDSRRSRFQFRVDRLEGCAAARLPVRLRIAWYGPRPPLGAGQRWQLPLRLKVRSGFFNPGGFDYEGWLLQQRIGGTGYVKDPDRALRLPGRFSVAASLQMWRQKVYDALQVRLPADPAAGLVLALALGERAHITPAQWRVLRATGTSHLVAISGLHIGLAAGFGWFLGLWFWKRSAYLCGRMPAQRAAAVPALALALVYAALAGFSIPTQRALVMLVVGMAALLAQRQPTPGHAWFVALLAVLILDPLAVLSPGFWLSFAAVAVLLFGMGARRAPRGFWWRWGRAQWLVGIGLLPMTLSAFQSLSVVGPLANLAAVPWVSLVVVPLVLGGTLLVSAWPGAAALSLQLACGALHWLWAALETVAAPPFATVSAAPSLIWLPLAGVGVAWLLAPRGFPGRFLGVVLLLPLWTPRGDTLKPGEMLVTLLDVGQGLAAVVRTANHVLVYDTGPRFSPDFDAGTAVLVPFLRHSGVSRVAMAIVSHGDRDHAGGYDSLRRAVTVDTVLAGEPSPRQQRCQDGSAWRWDGVAFELLHPRSNHSSSGNDASCVLRVVSEAGAVLFSGDIQGRGERLLVERPQRLRSEVLIAPHHGSASSSSPPFIASVAPRWVLFATGYRNRFGFPRPDVLARYRAADAEALSTAECGAIQVAFRDPGPPIPVCTRRLRGHYWNRR